MPLATRIIPCLDVDNGRVVKGINFKNLVDAGDPVQLAKMYAEQGADEITFLDISASRDNKETMLDVVRKTADAVFIPLTVGGGIKSVADVDYLLRAGADKISINTSAINNPDLINEISNRFGSQVLVISIDARRTSEKYATSGFEVTTHGGTKSCGLDALAWTIEAVQRGAGEVLLNSMDKDGTKDGFDLELIRYSMRCPNPARGSFPSLSRPDFERFASNFSRSRPRKPDASLPVTKIFSMENPTEPKCGAPSGPQVRSA